MASDTESVDLSLSPQKPPVLQGDQGLSVKSDGNCNASYYYSISRLQVSGEITNLGESHSVTGSAWLDREWSSSVLADHQVGWDWFALQLTDGRDLMIYQLRDKAGRPDTHSYAVEIEIAGNKTIIPFRQIQLDIERWWQSP
jgi:predicted secreted hydrolase